MLVKVWQRISDLDHASTYAIDQAVADGGRAARWPAAGPPPAGISWLDQIRRKVGEAPPLTEHQRHTLALLLQPEPESFPALPASRMSGDDR